MSTSLILSIVDPAGNVRDSINPCELAQDNQDLSAGPVNIPLAAFLANTPMPIPPMFLNFFKNLTVRLEITNEVEDPTVVEGECQTSAECS